MSTSNGGRYPGCSRSASRECYTWHCAGSTLGPSCVLILISARSFVQLSVSCLRSSQLLLCGTLSLRSMPGFGPSRFRLRGADAMVNNSPMFACAATLSSFFINVILNSSPAFFRSRLGDLTKTTRPRCPKQLWRGPRGYLICVSSPCWSNCTS